MCNVPREGSSLLFMLYFGNDEAQMTKERRCKTQQQCHRRMTCDEVELRTALLREARRRADLANRRVLHVCDIPPHPSVPDDKALTWVREANKHEEERMARLASHSQFSFCMIGDC